MTEIKPVYQMTIKSSGFFSQIPITTENERERDKWKAAGHEVRTLYPAAAYEALQKENAELKRNHKFTCENLANTVPFIKEIEQKNAAQAKRIDELYDVANAHRYSYIAAAKVIETQKSEIESLRKQVEMLLGSARKTVLALAHASIHDPLYTAAYDELSESIKLASKNGE